MTFTENWPEGWEIFSLDFNEFEFEQLKRELCVWDILSDEALVRAMLQASRIYVPVGFMQQGVQGNNPVPERL